MDGHAHFREAWHLLRERMESRSVEVDRQTQTIGSICQAPICDAKMYHMRKATVRDLRYRFREVENFLREGEEIQITKRKRVIARLVPAKPAVPSRRPDFLARLKKIYRGKPLKVSGAELVSRERDRD